MDEKIDRLVDALLETQGVGLERPSEMGHFTLGDAYRVAHRLYHAQLARGERLAGRKVGLSNRAAWPRLGLTDIVWGYLFGASVLEAKDNHARLELAGLEQPRLEPEIVFGLRSAPPADAAPEELMKAVEWLALGFEVVQCPYPDWQFAPADLVATFGFHGALVVGKKLLVSEENAAELARALPACLATLRRGDEVVAEGGGANVLGSPLEALAHLARLTQIDEAAPPLAAGEWVSSGTLTAAPDIRAGETYSASVTGLPLPELTLELA